ncbi:Phosphomethylpyrimidine kinase-domain-containing protein [Tuber borchii]|uniref:Phosphomethylpyrimidine kinase-domain-containing protein n=1 Tax=Tuber borchii TaxID=42251 RepID=A0A2T6ZQS7_TUBBO|nr:Phosphomethylpyrimidine kinase-domain-containing protein [Tuber borchii]
MPNAEIAIPRVLTIAGSDSSGGAGIEADLKVITANGCYGMTAITALTAQNTLGVDSIHHIPGHFLRSCLEAVLSDVGTDVVKTGMLGSEENVLVVAEILQKYGITKTVIDPVIISTTGSKLLPECAANAIREKLFPLALILTPNIPEAIQFLPGHQSLNSLDELMSAAKVLGGMGPKNILLKGGHLPFRRTEGGYVPAGKGGKEIVIDVFWDGNDFALIESPYVNTKNTHGTGCSLASAIASNLARGMEVLEAVRAGCSYVSAGISSAFILGKGHGPINHLHSNYIMPFAPGRFVDYLLSHPSVKPIWYEYTHHQFTTQLGAGTLGKKSFQHYLIQDYLFLIQFARANSLAGYKSMSIPTISKTASIVQYVVAETSLHLDYCSRFGLTQPQVEETEESLACTAYTRFVLDIGMSQDFFALQVAMAPCLLGYQEVALRLAKEGKKDDNIYWEWVESYSGKSYGEAVIRGRELLEDLSQDVGVKRISELVAIFAKATRMERNFWQMGLEGS